MTLSTLRDAGDLSGKRVLVRVDWSVPFMNGEIESEYQIQESLPTITWLQQAGAKIIIATHLEHEGDSVEHLRKYVPEGAELLDNLRKNPGEKANDEAFAKELAQLADIYVNDAFPVSHREHASIVGVPKYIPGYLGLGIQKEMENLSRAFDPLHPFLFILGGAKFETKLPLVNKFLDLADEIVIAGANAAQAHAQGFEKNPKISLPLGDIAALDANEENLAYYKSKIEKSAFVVWNGPLGKYEDGYKEGTLGLAKILAESGKESIVGGGDTLSAIHEQNLLDRFGFVSTGGGAMLDFLANETLPGIEALKR